MPGETIEDAIGAGIDLNVLGLGAVYERLAPAPTDAAGSQAALDHHLRLLARLRETELDGELTVDLAGLGLELDEDRCLGHLRALAGAAEEQGSYLWLDAHAAAHVDRAIDLYQRLRATHGMTGITLRASLRRTAKDVERLLPLGPAVRLGTGHPIGAPAAAALASRTEIDANTVGLAVTLLRESRTRSMRIVFATGDAGLVEQIASHAAAAGVARDAFGIEMPYDIRAREQQGLEHAGYTVRVLVPYGPAWYPWYVRRVADRPSALLAIPRRALPW